MNNDLSSFAARMREIIDCLFSHPSPSIPLPVEGRGRKPAKAPFNKSVYVPDARAICSSEIKFNELALELFGLQFAHNAAYRRICEGRKLTPEMVAHWTQIPFVPTSAFKELELTSLASNERTAVFHSSGTTEQRPSRHFHNADSLKLYEASLWAGFSRNILQKPKAECGTRKLICLTPPPTDVPHSSLVHMFETVRRKLSAPETAFIGRLDVAGAWILNFDSLLNVPGKGEEPRLLLGTAFSFVHLVDFLAEKNLRLQLPHGSRVMETGGYKNRSRTMPKAELHALITEYLSVSAENIICEYGMSELSSQAYDSDFGKQTLTSPLPSPLPSEWERRGDREWTRLDTQIPESVRRGQSSVTAKAIDPDMRRLFHFPSWARVQIVSPEKGREVMDGETGLVRILDLANVYSVAAIQTEDLGVRYGDGFELIGRVQLAEPRGCSLMVA